MPASTKRSIKSYLGSTGDWKDNVSILTMQIEIRKDVPLFLTLGTTHLSLNTEYTHKVEKNTGINVMGYIFYLDDSGNAKQM